MDLKGKPPRAPIPRGNESDPPPAEERVGRVPSYRPPADETVADQARQALTMAESALKGVNELKAARDGDRAGIEAHVVAVVRGQVDPIRASLKRQDDVLGQLLSYAEDNAARLHRKQMDTLDEAIKVESLQEKKVTVEHAVAIDPRISGKHQRLMTALKVFGFVIGAIASLWTAVAMSRGGQHAEPVHIPEPPDERAAPHH